MTAPALAAEIDERDWEFRSVFTDEIDVDHSSYRPGSAARMSADDWVARARGLFPELVASLTVTWNQGNGAVLTLAAERVAAQAAEAATPATSSPSGVR